MKTTILASHLLLGVLAAGIQCAPVAAQEPNGNSSPSWQTRVQQLKIWASSVKSVRCNFFLSRFTNSQSRADKMKFWQGLVKQYPTAAPLPNDSNSGYSCFWVADSTRWRCDQSRFYPITGLDLKRCIFDGERYINYDQYHGRAVISPQNESDCVEKNLQSDTWMQFGVDNMLTPTSPDASGDFKLIGESVVAGRKSSIYQAQTPKDTLTICADQATPLLLQWKEVYHSKPDQANVSIYTWSDIRQVNGIPIPFQCKLETYRINQGTNLWEQTFLFKLKECQINSPVGDGFFQDVIPVGTTLEDEIENPNTISSVGGNSSTEAERIRLGTPPPLEESDAKVEGALPKP